MKYLKKAENKMAYTKIGLYGEAGSGKTYTSAQFAIGLHKYAKLKKPVAMFDTEPASYFIMPYFQQAGIEFFVYEESRALADLLGFMDEAEKDCSIVIIDSITHIWREVQTAYLNKTNENLRRWGKKPIDRLEFHHWAPIKNEFSRFTDKFLSCKMHAIVCGRAGCVYEYQENDKGKKELITVGSKMASEKEMGYEPSLLIEMTKDIQHGKLINKAFVEKDRSNRLNGKSFSFPTFKDIKPHIDFINIGGEHFGSMSKRDSKDLFDPSGDDGWTQEKKQREIFCEEIKSLLVTKGLDGSSKDAKEKRIKLLNDVFQTGSWTKIENMNSREIKAGFESMQSILSG